MIQAGTAADYDGLYRSVREFRPPSAEELAKAPSRFPENAEVSAMVDTMVEIDQRWDQLKALAVHLDSPNKAASEAVLLWEQIREAQRLPESANLGKSFQAKMTKSEEAALRLRMILAAHVKGEKLSAPNLRGAMDEVAKSCKRCHEAHRDSVSDPRP
jgi:hypothetical protein